MTILRALPILLLATAPAAPGAPTAGFTVARAGGPSATVATLAEALAAERRLHAEQRGVEVVLTFPPGLLRLAAPIVLDARDNGTVLRAAPGGTTLSGAAVIAPAGTRRIADPRLRTLAAYRFGAQEPPSAPLVFAGAERLRLASWPAEGYRQDWRVEQTPDGPLVHPPSGVLLAISGPVLVSGYFGPGWAWDAIPATPRAGGLLLARTPEFGIAPAPRLRVSGTLALAPRRYAPDAEFASLGSPASAPIELAVTPTLLTITNAQHLRVEGLAFERSAGDAIRIKDSSDITLSACTVRQTGALGVSIDGGHRVVIDRCRITETAGTAIFVSGGGRALLEPSGHAVTGSLIANYGQQLPTAPALVVWGVATLIRGDRITGGGGPAIALQGNDHRIEGNEIGWAVCEAEDAGAIYLGRDWTQRGIVIAGNYFHDIGGAPKVHAAGVYLDDLASGATVSRNVFFHMPFGVILGGGRDNRIQDNMFAAMGNAAVAFDARATGWAAALVQPGGPLRTRLAQMPYRDARWRARYPTLAALPEDRPAEPIGNVMRGNARIEAQPVWSLTPGYTLAPEDDRTPPPTPADRAALDGPDRGQAYAVLARLAGMGATAPWRAVPSPLTGCPR